MHFLTLYFTFPIWSKIKKCQDLKLTGTRNTQFYLKLCRSYQSNDSIIIKVWVTVRNHLCHKCYRCWLQSHKSRWQRHSLTSFFFSLGWLFGSNLFRLSYNLPLCACGTFAQFVLNFKNPNSVCLGWNVDWLSNSCLSVNSTRCVQKDRGQLT